MEIGLLFLSYLILKGLLQVHFCLKHITKLVSETISYGAELIFIRQNEEMIEGLCKNFPAS